MPYTQFDEDGPDGTTGDGSTVITTITENDLALRDAVVAGVMPGWDMTPSGGTADEPATITWDKGTERVKEDITWGSSGGADGNPTQIILSYSSNSGGAYDTMGTQTISYDVNGNVTSITWS